MEISEYKNIFENEEDHFLYTSRHKTVFSLIKKYIGDKRSNLKILDAGSGTGLLAKKLAIFGSVSSIDISQEAIKFARLRGIKTKRASVTKIPFRSNSFDLVVSIDVVYHKAVKNDERAISEFFRVLKPGGILIIRVPANNWIRTKHDKHVHTRQRYNIKELKVKLQKEGFLIKKLTFTNMILLPLSVIQHTLDQFKSSKETKSAVYKTPKVINNLLIVLLNLEVFLLTRFYLPFGVGIFAVASKPLRNKITSRKKSG